MENYVFDNDKDATEEVLTEAMDDSDEGFMKGYSEEDSSEECAECGGAVKPEKKITKELGEETFVFCSKHCAQEFEESMAEE